MKSLSSRSKILVIGNSGSLSVELIKSLTSSANVVHYLNLAGDNSEILQKLVERYNTISYTNVTQFKNPNASFNIVLSNFLEASPNYNVQQNLYNEEKLYKLLFDNNLFASRTLLVYPQKKLSVYKKYTDALLDSIDKKENTGVLLLGDLLDLDLPKRDDILLNKIINSIASKKIAAPKKEFNLHPVTYQTSANHILNNLFSFGPINLEKVFVAGPQISVSNLLALIAGESSDFEFFYDNVEWDLEEHAFHAREAVETDIKGVIKQLVSKKKNEVGDIPPFARTGLQEKSEVKTVPVMPPTEDVPVKPVKNSRSIFRFLRFKKKKPMFLLIALAIFFVAVPYLAYVGSSMLVSKIGESGASVHVGVARVLGVSAVGGFEARNSVPVLGSFEENYLLRSQLNNEIVDIYTSLSKRDQKYAELIEDIAKGIEQKEAAESMASEYKNIYEKTLFVLSKNNNHTNAQVELLEKIRNDSLTKSVLLPEVHELAGFDSKKTYLIAVQDNRELRANGGFILAAGSVTLENAQITDFNVSDIYSLNKQFNGEFEAPGDIRKYLGTDSLQMHDVNWEIDFTKSAQILQTFFERSGGEAVDGVVVFDLELIKNMIGKKGVMVDNKLVTSDNLYDILASSDNVKVETENFSAKLTGAILAKLQNSNGPAGFMDIDLVEQFNQKHIQATTDFTQVFANLKWDGGVYARPCSDNCFSDVFGIVESNVGITKVDEVERKISLNASIQNLSVNKNAELELFNNSESTYKNYIRIITPTGSVFSSLQIKKASGATATQAITEKNNIWQSTGFFVEIAPGERLSANITWSNPLLLDFSKEGQYVMSVRKQPGINSIPVEISFEVPQEIKSNLTNGMQLRYNTNLVSDERFEVHWK